jgi:predicted signal transduction protein with EAL and GGDEF domain
MIARLDRAGFAVLHEHRPEHARPPATPAELASRLAEALTETTYVADLGLAVTASIGVVQSPPHSANPVEFVQAADLALRLATEQGPGQWRLLTPDEGAREQRSLRFAAAMPGAFETGELSVGYRRRIVLADEQLVSVEAYPLWKEAELVGQDCLALAEATGLSPLVGRWLLRTAGEALGTWHTDLPVSVSLSPNQSAAPDLVDAVLGTLSDQSLPANLLRLAMPAPEVFDGRPQAVDNMTTLAKNGVRMAVHDFSGNPSELVRLPDLPLSAVSLAPRLIAQARAVNRKSLVAKAVTSLVSLVHEAGLLVSVDDLRTEPEIAWWREAGADTATGPLARFRVNPEESPG